MLPYHDYNAIISVQDSSPRQMVVSKSPIWHAVERDFRSIERKSAKMPSVRFSKELKASSDVLTDSKGKLGSLCCQEWASLPTAFQAVVFGLLFLDRLVAEVYMHKSFSVALIGT